jgi:hypothetical protein
VPTWRGIHKNNNLKLHSIVRAVKWHAQSLAYLNTPCIIFISLIKCTLIAKQSSVNSRSYNIYTPRKASSLIYFQLWCWHITASKTVLITIFDIDYLYQVNTCISINYDCLGLLNMGFASTKKLYLCQFSCTPV